MTTVVLVSVILGMIVIASVGSLLWQQKGYIAEKVFGKLPGLETIDGEFVPYEIGLTAEEQAVIDSMNALVCALNSVAIGEFRPDDPTVCPTVLPGVTPESKEEEPEKKEPKEPAPSLTPVGKAVYNLINKITGAAVTEKNTATFGDAKVSCQGASSKTVFLTHSPQSVNIGSWQGHYFDRDYAKKKAVEQIGDMIIDCWEDNYQKTARPYVKCSVAATFPLLGKDIYNEKDAIYITEDDIMKYLESLIEYGVLDEDTLDYLDGSFGRGNRIHFESKLEGTDYRSCGEKSNKDKTNNICGKPSRKRYNDAYCVYFDRAGELTANLFGIKFGTKGVLGFMGVTRDTVLLTDCHKNLQAVETFTCSVENFYLPQKEAETEWIVDDAWEFAQYLIGATGDPQWLVAYESFPVEATSFWRKNFFSEVFSLRSAVVVVGSGVLNYGFVKGGQIAGKLGKFIKPGKVVEKAGVKATAEVADAVGRNMAKELSEEGGEVIVNRLIANGGDNMIRSLMVEEGLQTLHGIGPKISKKITDRILSIVGKSSGKSFEKVEKEVAEGITDVIFKEVKQTPEEYITRVMQREGYRIAEEKVIKETALHEYREAVAKQVMDNLDLGGQKGIKGLFANKLSTTAAREIMKRQGFERFLANFLEQGGKKLNAKLVEETAENTLKKIGLLNRFSKAYSDRILKMSRGMVDELMRGTFGGKSGAEAAKLMVTSVGKKGLLTKTGGVVKGAGWLVWENLPIRLVQAKYWITLTPVGGATASIGKTFAHLPVWMYKHRYPMLVLLGAGMLMHDSANEKILPVGGNALALNTPTVQGESHRFPMHDDALKYFVRNQHKPSERLYLVSPCKTKLLIKKTKCECVNDPLTNKFNFGNTGLINIKPGSVVPKDEATLRTMIEEEYGEIAKLTPAELEEKLNDLEFIRKGEPVDLWWEIKVFMEAYKQALDAGKSKEEAIASAKRVYKTEFARVFEMEEEPTEDDLSLIKEAIDELTKYYEDHKSTDKTLLEFIVQYKLSQIEGFYTGIVQSKSLGSSENIETTFWGLPIIGKVERTMDTSYRIFEPYEKYMDTTNLIKECGSRGAIDSIFDMLKHDVEWYGDVLGKRWEDILKGKMVYSHAEAKRILQTSGSGDYFDAAAFQVECLEAYPYSTEYYCYDDYPAQAMAKTAVHVTALIIDVIVSIGSGGTAAPAVFFLTGATAGAADVVISATEFWPLSTRWARELGQKAVDIKGGVL